jgi:hypothetical protein
MRKHKYLWTAVLAVTLVALAGLAHARGGLIGSKLPAGNASDSASASSDNSCGCPLQWLKSVICGGD